MQVVLHAHDRAMKTSRSSGRMNRSAVSSREKFCNQARQVFPQQPSICLKSGDGIGIGIRKNARSARRSFGHRPPTTKIAYPAWVKNSVSRRTSSNKPKRSINSGGITPSRYCGMTKPGGFGKGRLPPTPRNVPAWTRSPARAKNTAAVKPLCPAPKTQTSHEVATPSG